MITNQKLADLQKQGQEAAATARAIAAKASAEHGEMTRDERRDFDAAMKTGGDLLEKIQHGKHDLGLLEMASTLAADVGGGMPGTGVHQGQAAELQGHGRTSCGPDDARRCQGTCALRCNCRRCSVHARPGRVGQAGAESARCHPGDRTRPDAYLWQTVRTNAAAVVVEGAVKPTSTYSVVKVPNSLVVVAHLSEGIPRFWIDDNATLNAFISNELETAGHSPAALVVHPLDWEGVELALSSTSAVEYQGPAL